MPCPLDNPLNPQIQSIQLTLFAWLLPEWSSLPLSSKMNDRYRRNVEEGYLKLYEQIGRCRQKSEGDRLWNELTKSITQFRKSLSKLETHAYEELSNRFERSCSTAPKSSDDSGRGTDSSRSQEEQPGRLFGEADFPPISAPIPTPKEEEDQEEDWTPLEPEESALRLPLPVYLRSGQTMRVKVLHVVSPLELYLLKTEDLGRLEDVARVLDASSDEMRQLPLSDECCVPDGACAALIDGELKRAVIRMKGTREVQVFLVDLGRTQFLSRSDVFMLPKNIATMAPALVHFCSLADCDVSQLDQTTVNTFVRAVAKRRELLIRAHGSRHRLLGGELIDILHDRVKKSRKSPSSSVQPDCQPPPAEQ